MNKLAIYVLCFLVAVAPACGTLSQPQKVAVMQVLDQELKAGHITQEQYAAAFQALANDGKVDWELWGVAAVNIALALIGAPAIVRWQRGVPTQLAGLPASKVYPDSSSS